MSEKKKWNLDPLFALGYEGQMAAFAYFLGGLEVLLEEKCPAAAVDDVQRMLDNAAAFANRGLRPGKVSLGELGPYDVLLPKERWNGHGIPYFKKEEADRYLADVHAAGYMKVAEYDAARDLYRFQEPDDEGPQEFLSTAQPPGYYCLGGGSWTWFVEEDPHAAPRM